MGAAVAVVLGERIALQLWRRPATRVGPLCGGADGYDGEPITRLSGSAGGRPTSFANSPSAWATDVSSRSAMAVTSRRGPATQPVENLL